MARWQLSGCRLQSIEATGGIVDKEIEQAISTLVDVANAPNLSVEEGFTADGFLAFQRKAMQLLAMQSTGQQITLPRCINLGSDLDQTGMGEAVGKDMHGITHSRQRILAHRLA